MHHHCCSHVFFDSSGSRWLVSFLDEIISRVPDSSWDRAASSEHCFSSRLKRLDFFSSNGDWLVKELVKLSTFCRQTWTASCTRTNNYSRPIRSTTSAFVSVSRTSRFGLEMAIWKNTGKWFEDEGSSTIMIRNTLTWIIFLPGCYEICIRDISLLELEQHSSLCNCKSHSWNKRPMQLIFTDWLHEV